MVHLYLVKPAGGLLPETGESCRPKCATKSEQEFLLNLAGSQRNHIRRLSRWLSEHPDLVNYLKDTKGKGKGKARDSLAEEELSKLKDYLEMRLEEIEPKSRLVELLAYTKHWIESFQERVEFIQSVKIALEHNNLPSSSLAEHSARIADQIIPTSPVQGMQKEPEASTQIRRQRSPSRSASPHPKPVSKKRKRTVDRGTSPLSEAHDMATSVTVAQAGTASENVIRTSITVAESPDHATKSISAITQVTLESTVLNEDGNDDDSPPSPQSLPSPPPHGQTRLKPLTQSGKDDSQASTAGSSNKAGGTPSIHTLPPADSSNSSAEDALHATVIQEIVSAEVRADTPRKEQTAGLEQNHVVKKKEKRKHNKHKLPPVSDEVMQKLKQAALEAERQREEERRKEDIYIKYDYWGELKMWEPPVGMDEETGK